MTALTIHEAAREAWCVATSKHGFVFSVPRSPAQILAWQVKWDETYGHVISGLIRREQQRATDHASN